MITSLSVTIVVNNFVSRSGMKGEHGLSLLIDIEEDNQKRKILWDTGQTSEILLLNLDSLSVKIPEISTVILSHGHYDHTGGLLELLDRSNGDVQVLASPFAWDDRFNNSQDLKQIGARLTPEDVLSHGGVYRAIDGPFQILEKLLVSGPIPKVEHCETNHTFLRSSGSGLMLDKFEDDMALVVDLGLQGIFIVTGCCHSGIINTIRHCMKITGNSIINGVLGGLHLINADSRRLIKTRDFLKDINCDFIAPIHCSGFEATCFLRRELGDVVKFPGAGETFKII